MLKVRLLDYQLSHKRNISKLAINLFITILLICCGGSAYGYQVEKQNNKDNKDKKEKKADKKDVKKDEKKSSEDDAITVAMLKEYGKTKYQKEPDFKEEVDKAYEEQKRSHRRQAFSINVRPPLRVMGDLEGEGGNFTAQGKGAAAAEDLGPKDALYENPMLQDYINRMGQSLVPNDSTKLYAFRILQDPLPRAESLSTGTIYISTGLLGMLDNEAQLAYILSHEIAHVEKDHWLPKTMLPVALKAYNEDQEEKAAEENKSRAKKRKIISIIGLAGLGGVLAGGTGAALGASFGADGRFDILAGLLIRDKVASTVSITEWDAVEEDEADKFAFETCLAKNYDVQEIPKLYATVREVVKADDRVSLGFIGSKNRVEERVKTAEKELQLNKDKIQELINKGQLIGSHSDFDVLMAEVKRDNGVVAFYYDMFDMARRNFEWSLRVRSDDAKAHYYYGRILKVTARNKEVKDKAIAEFTTALKLDQARGSLPGVRLQLALGLMDQRDPSKNNEIMDNIKEYIRLYKLNNGGSVPQNMDILYDYMTQVGEKSYFVPPTSNISTQGIPPVNVQPIVEKPEPTPNSTSTKPIATGNKRGRGRSN